MVRITGKCAQVSSGESSGKGILDSKISGNKVDLKITKMHPVSMVTKKSIGYATIRFTGYMSV